MGIQVNLIGETGDIQEDVFKGYIREALIDITGDEEKVKEVVQGFLTEMDETELGQSSQIFFNLNEKATELASKKYFEHVETPKLINQEGEDVFETSKDTYYKEFSESLEIGFWIDFER
jgi:hypothetical protein